jgi:FkbM family methyltransferase
MNRAVHILKSAIRRAANGLGYDIVGHDGKNARWRLAQFFASADITTVFDVGANRGTYGWELREMGFDGAIVSFEPMQEAFAQLKTAAGSDPKWRVVNIGLGDKDEELLLNVAANSESSSFLPMLAAHEEAAPESRYLKQEPARIRRLDGVVRDHAAADTRIFLKIDTQGFEKHVLEGARGMLEQVPLIQIECSLVPLYGGVDTIEGMIAFLRGLGYAPIDTRPTFHHRDNHHLMQMDVIFARQ